MPIESFCGIACEGVGRSLAPLWLVGLLIIVLVPLIMRRPWYGLVAYFAALFLFPTNSVTNFSMFREAVLFFILGLALLSLWGKVGFGAVSHGSRGLLVLPRGLVGIILLLAAIIAITSYELWLRPDFFKPTYDAAFVVARWKYLQVINSVLLAVLVYQLIRSRREFESALKIMVVMGLILAAQALFIYPFRNEIFGAIGYNTEGFTKYAIEERLIELTRFSSASIGRVFMWPALLALFLGLSIKGPAKAQMLLWGMVIMLALLLTFTRAAYLGVTVSVITFVMVSPIFRRIRAIAVISIVIVGLGSSIIITSADTGFDTGGGVDRFTNPVSQIISRSSAWGLSIRAFKESPITGHGFGTSSRIVGGLSLEYGLYGGAPGRSLHQFYLDWLTDMGVLGLGFIALLIFAIVTLLYSTARQARRYGITYVSTYGTILLAVLPSALAFVFFDSAFILPQLFLWLSLGYVLKRLLNQELKKTVMGSSTESGITGMDESFIEAESPTR